MIHNKYIKNMSLCELIQLKNNLKTYSSMKSIVGNKARQMYTNMYGGENLYIVEYSAQLDLDYVQKFAKKIYKEHYKEDIPGEKIQFIAKNDIAGGMRVIRNDMMVDVTWEALARQYNS